MALKAIDRRRPSGPPVVRYAAALLAVVWCSFALVPTVAAQQNQAQATTKPPLSKPAATKKPAATPAKPKAAPAKPKAAAAKPAAKPKAVPAKPGTATAAKPAPATPPAPAAARRPAAPQSAAAVVPPGTTGGTRGFMDNFATRAVASLNGKGAAPARRTDLETLMRDSFDFQKIGQFVLGKTAETTPAEKQAAFRAAFADYAISKYAQHLTSFQITSMTVQTTRPAPEGGDVMVDTAIERQGKPPAVFSWRVSQGGAQPRLVDVVVDNVSLATTQREEFASYINRRGLDALIDQMRQQVASARQL
jgi:phospholipid transport system substrate-binding protein